MSVAYFLAAAGSEADMLAKFQLNIILYILLLGVIDGIYIICTYLRSDLLPTTHKTEQPLRALSMFPSFWALVVLPL